MIRQSRVAPFIMLTESLVVPDLSGSAMAINGMKVLTRASEDGGVTLTKSGAFHQTFVTWAAHQGWKGNDRRRVTTMPCLA